MVSIAGFTPRGWWLGALRRRLAAPARPAAVTLDPHTERAPARRRYYPPQRDHVFERSAMAREMYRL